MTIGESHSPGEHRVGPYLLHEELGRGGQGTVYRATDTRLGRHVALKVLERVGNVPPEVLARFSREAAAAAKLDHPSICAVYEAGVEAGVPFIAMRLIEGESLAKKIADATGATAESSLVSFQDAELVKGSAPAFDSTVAALPGADQIRALTTLAAKSARALHLAHEAGIVHRDIKPANIIVTPAGDPVIMDFGLARDDSSEQTVTRTGDLFGTPAYMSPEQLTRQTIHLDRRTDVWSLGVTLYELLTLRRPFDAPTRERLYQAIIGKEPQDPRRLNPAISKDLAAIIETAVHKDLDRRYQTAAAMGADLEASAAGRPVAARRVGPLGRLARWSRREPAKAALLLLSIVVLPTIAVLVTSNLVNRDRVESARLLEIQNDKDEVLSQGSYELGEGDPDRAIDQFKRVLTMEGGSPEAVAGIALAHLKRERPKEALAVLDTHDNLVHGRRAAIMLCAQATRALGRKEEADSLARSAPEPVDPLDFYLEGERLMEEGHGGRQPAFREALDSFTQAILLSSAPRAIYFEQRAHAAGHAKDRQAQREMAQALRRHWPHSAVAVFWGGFALLESNQVDDAIAAFREAIRIKPNFTMAYANLGNALSNKGLIDDAIATFREAIRIKSDYSHAHYGLGRALGQKGLLDEAATAYREAIRLKPDYAEAQVELGITLGRKGLLDEAIACFRAAIKIRPDYPEGHLNLGTALQGKGRLDEAIAAFREGTRFKPDDAGAQTSLGVALGQRGLAQEAIAAFREAIRINPGYGEAHFNLGATLLDNGLTDEAITACREAITLDRNDAEAHCNLGIALQRKGLLDEAVAALRESIRLKPDGANAHCSLGHALRANGQIQAALEQMRKGDELGSTQPEWQQPSASWVKALEQLAHLEEHMLEVAAGKATPDGPADLLALAGVASMTRRWSLAAKWYADALEQDPGVAQGLGIGPVRAAVQASVHASAESHPVSEGDRARRRTQALEWIEAELRHEKDAVEAGDMDRKTLGQVLEAWLTDPMLGPVRDEGALKALPPDQARAWSAFWDEVRKAK